MTRGFLIWGVCVSCGGKGMLKNATGQPALQSSARFLLVEKSAGVEMSQSAFLIAWIIVYFNVVIIADLLRKTLNTLTGEEICIYL